MEIHSRHELKDYDHLMELRSRVCLHEVSTYATRITAHGCLRVCQPRFTITQCMWSQGSSLISGALFLAEGRHEASLARRVQESLPNCAANAQASRSSCLGADDTSCESVSLGRSSSSIPSTHLAVGFKIKALKGLVPYLLECLVFGDFSQHEAHKGERRVLKAWS